jgi:hypothetical protein
MLGRVGEGSVGDFSPQEYPNNEPAPQNAGSGGTEDDDLPF